MFILCTHCQFLVSLDAHGQPPPCCPNCDEPLTGPVAKTLPSIAATAAPDAAMQDAPATDAPTAEPSAANASATHDTPTATVDNPAEPATPAPPGDVVVDVADRSGELGGIATTSHPAMDVPADGTMHEAPGEAADVIAEAMLGPAAIEVEVDAQRLDTQPETGPADTPAAPDSSPAPRPVARRRAKPAPSFVRQAAADTRLAARSWASLAAIAGLSLLLLLQLLLADRARLSADARWRPALAALCDVLRCSLPPWREPAAFALLDRNVRPHPSVPGVLRVTATFRNDARWAQPWPALLLTLSDVDGRAVGARVFDARDYLGASPTRTGLESGQRATIAMDVREPSPRIVAFTFDFH